MKKSRLHLVDNGYQITECDSDFYLYWNKGSVLDGQSLSQLVDSSATYVRREFLNWINKLGNEKLGKESLVERFSFSENQSFFWLMPLVERSLFKSGMISSLLKFLVLEEYVVENGIGEIFLYSSDMNLHKCLSSWCDQTGRVLVYREIKSKAEVHNIRSFFNSLPHPVQAGLGLLRKVFRRLIAGKLRGMDLNSRELTVLSYYPSYDQQLKSEGIYRSHYWADLHDLLDSKSVKTNQIFQFSNNDKESFRSAVKNKRLFNNNKARINTKYFMLESLLTFQGILTAIKLYFQVWRANFKSPEISSLFVFPNKSLNFWEYVENDWKSGAYGFGCMESALMLSLFKEMFDQVGENSKVLYLWENQAWEKCMIYSRFQSPEVELIGYQHTPPRFWDLRMFQPSVCEGQDVSIEPVVDVLATGCSTNEEFLASVDYCASSVRSVEMVRYGHLSPERLSDVSGQGNSQNLLVLTGYKPEECFTQLDVLAQALVNESMRQFDKIIVKAHPDTPVDEMLKKLNLFSLVVISQESIGQLIPTSKVIFTANSTSSSIEALMQGSKVLIMGGSDSVNLSALFKIIPDHTFINSHSDFIEAIKNIEYQETGLDYLCLDGDYVRWTSVLNILKET